MFERRVEEGKDGYGVVQVVNPESTDETELLVDELGEERVLELVVLGEELGCG